MAQQEIESFMDSHGITVESVFVPFSQSRNKGDWQSLNWRGLNWGRKPWKKRTSDF